MHDRYEVVMIMNGFVATNDSFQTVIWFIGDIKYLQVQAKKKRKMNLTK